MTNRDNCGRELNDSARFRQINGQLLLCVKCDKRHGTRLQQQGASYPGYRRLVRRIGGRRT